MYQTISRSFKMAEESTDTEKYMMDRIFNTKLKDCNLSTLGKKEPLKRMARILAKIKDTWNQDLTRPGLLTNLFLEKSDEVIEPGVLKHLDALRNKKTKRKKGDTSPNFVPQYIALNFNGVHIALKEWFDDKAARNAGNKKRTANKLTAGDLDSFNTAVDRNKVTIDRNAQAPASPRELSPATRLPTPEILSQGGSPAKRGSVAPHERSKRRRTAHEVSAPSRHQEQDPGDDHFAEQFERDDPELLSERSNNEVAELEASNKRLMEKCTDLELALKGSEGKCAGLKLELKGSEEKCADLELELKGFEGKCAQLQRENEELKAQLSAHDSRDETQGTRDIDWNARLRRGFRGRMLPSSFTRQSEPDLAAMLQEVKADNERRIRQGHPETESRQPIDEDLCSEPQPAGITVDRDKGIDLVPGRRKTSTSFSEDQVWFTHDGVKYFRNA